MLSGVGGAVVFVGVWVVLVGLWGVSKVVTPL